MTRYAAGHAAETRARLVALAAARLREAGVAAVGVQPLMRAAGLTHGGFYAHFASRETLLAAAVAALFETSAAPVAREGEDSARTLRRFVRAYLSPAHAADVTGGCPVAALAGEARRLAGDAAERYRRGVAGIVARLAAMLAAAGRDPTMARSLLAELAGSVMLARLEPDEAARVDLLKAAEGAVSKRLEL